MIKFFDSKSSVSMMRLLSFISMLSGCGLGAYGIYAGRDLTSLAVLCGVFVSAAMGGKVAQKIVEKGDS